MPMSCPALWLLGWTIRIPMPSSHSCARRQMCAPAHCADSSIIVRSLPSASSIFHIAAVCNGAAPDATRGLAQQSMPSPR